MPLDGNAYAAEVSAEQRRPFTSKEMRDGTLLSLSCLRSRIERHGETADNAVFDLLDLAAELLAFAQLKAGGRPIDRGEHEETAIRIRSQLMIAAAVVTEDAWRCKDIPLSSQDRDTIATGLNDAWRAYEETIT